MIRGVIFDLDGVLVRTDALHYRAWKQLADAEGIYFDFHINDRLRGVSRMDSLNIILERAPRRYDATARQAMADRKNAAYVDLLSTLRPADVLPGVVGVLEGLRQRGVRRAVASASRNARTILDRCSLTARFDAIVDGNDVTRSKPDPEVFSVAAARLGLPAGDCLVVEDAMAGIEAARAAGMQVLGIGTPQSLPGVSPVVSGLVEITADAMATL